MSDNTKYNSLIPEKYHLIVVLLAYLLFALIFGLAYRFAINPDGLSIIRLAGYIAEGNFIESVNSSLSPLMIWLISPFLFIGFEGLIAARIAIALSGAFLLLSSWYLSLRFELSHNLRFIAMLIAALLISDWSIQNIGADLMVAALIVYYLYIVTNPDILNNRKVSFYCGLVGGFSYLAHHYSFPFFLAHFPVMLILRGYIDRDESGFELKKVMGPLAFGLAGFFIVSSLWVAAISVKQGRLTWSSKGPIAYAHMGPDDVSRRHPSFFGGLHKPTNPLAIHVFEDAAQLKHETWSPFQNKKYFLHQLQLIIMNINYVINHFVNQSPFFTYPLMVGVLTFMAIAFLLITLNNAKKFLYLWIIITFSIYSSGWILILARSPRRFYGLMLVVLFLSFHFINEFKIVMNDMRGKAFSRGREKILILFLLLITIHAFTLKPGMLLLKSIKNIITVDYVNPYKEMALQINTIQFLPPYANIRSAQKSHTDYYIAYYLDKQFLGRPLNADMDRIISELEEADAKSLLVFDNAETVEKLKNDKRFVHVASKKLKKDKRYAYAANIEQDEIKGWDEEVNVFALKRIIFY